MEIAAHEDWDLYASAQPEIMGLLATRARAARPGTGQPQHGYMLLDERSRAPIESACANPMSPCVGVAT